MNDTRLALKAKFESDRIFRASLQSLHEAVDEFNEDDRVEFKLEKLDKICGDRPAAVKFAKQLQQLGIGRFLAGRRGRPSRFRWSYEPASIVDAVSGTGELRPRSEQGRSPAGTHAGQEQPVGAVESILAELKMALARLHGVPVSGVDVSFTIRK